MTDPTVLLQALILGIVEGLTEFLPISSTGHLILVGWLIDFHGPDGRIFEVAIQLGAIVAICVLYFQRLWKLVVSLPSSKRAQNFALAIILGFLPAMVLGLMFHSFIKTVLFSPWVVVTTLFIGGVLILVIERSWHQVRIREAEDITPRLAIAVGFCQALAMIPGTSRSGATILGGLMLGLDRKAAAEFSFFLAIPTMLAATVYDLYKVRDSLTGDGLLVIAVGFVAAMISAMLVVRALMRFLQSHTFEIFGWYRIGLAVVMAIALSVQA